MGVGAGADAFNCGNLGGADVMGTSAYSSTGAETSGALVTGSISQAPPASRVSSSMPCQNASSFAGTRRRAGRHQGQHDTQAPPPSSSVSSIEVEGRSVSAPFLMRATQILALPCFLGSLHSSLSVTVFLPGEGNFWG